MTEWREVILKKTPALCVRLQFRKQKKWTQSSFWARALTELCASCSLKRPFHTNWIVYWHCMSSTSIDFPSYSIQKQPIKCPEKHSLWQLHFQEAYPGKTRTIRATISFHISLPGMSKGQILSNLESKQIGLCIEYDVITLKKWCNMPITAVKPEEWFSC